MADSKARQIVDALIAAFEGIQEDGGVTYWYTPKAVYPVAWPGDEFLRPDKETLYLLVPDVEEKEHLTFTHVKGVLRLDLAVLRQFKRPGGDDPRSTAETRWEIQDRLVQDAEKLIRTENASSTGPLDGLALHIFVPTIDRSAEETYHPAWVCAFLRLEVLYEHLETTP